MFSQNRDKKQDAWGAHEPLLPHPSTEPDPRPARTSSPSPRIKRAAIAATAFVSLLAISCLLRYNGFLRRPPHGPPFIPSPSPVRASTTSLATELEPSLLASNFTPSTLVCPPIDRERYSQFGKDSSGGDKHFIAINLYNSEIVLPTLGRAVLDLAAFLGEENVHVSIFENGSQDRTVELLGVLKGLFDRRRIENTILSDETKTNWKSVDRIAQLAVYRNIVLEPASNSSSSFTNVIFFNDVFVCASDALELLYQRKVQNASATCGLDWIEKKSGWYSGGKAVFYDSWVTRGLSGRTIRPQFDLFRRWRDNVAQLWNTPGEEYSKERFDLGLPIPVYSCWNGLFVVDARPFRGEDQNGKSIEPVSFRSGDVEKNECTASECKLVAKDLWRRGFNRFVIVPTVRLTYVQSLYESAQLSSLYQRRFLPSYDTARELIDWKAMKAPELVECWAYLRRWKADFWWMARWESP